MLEIVVISAFFGLPLAAYIGIHQIDHSLFQYSKLPLFIFIVSIILFQIKMITDFKNHIKSKKFKEWWKGLKFQGIWGVFWLMVLISYGMSMLIMLSPFISPFMYLSILSLRITLYLSHQKPNDRQTRCIPWNYARFLSYAADRKLLQQTGGAYRFIHRSLLEHFAKMGETGSP